MFVLNMEVDFRMAASFSKIRSIRKKIEFYKSQQNFLSCSGKIEDLMITGIDKVKGLGTIA